MEYFLGSILTLFCIYMVNKIIQKRINNHISAPIFSQSRKYYVLKYYLKYKKKNNSENQSNKNLNRKSIRGIVVDDSVYWIENGFLVNAKLINGKPDENSKKRVDTHNMNDVELKRIVFIVDKLSEGRSDDTGNTGNKEF